jgi:hypothetical protein
LGKAPIAPLRKVSCFVLAPETSVSTDATNTCCASLCDSNEFDNDAWSGCPDLDDALTASAILSQTSARVAQSGSFFQQSN